MIVSMNSLDHILFNWLAAGYQPQPQILLAAGGIATYAIGVVPLALLVTWIVRPEGRRTVLNAMLAGGLGLLAAEVLSAWIGRPRPFMIGLSPLYLPHAAEGSFPSAHASVMLAVSLCLLFSRRTRFAGGILLLLGLITGWARVYTGLHFPLDIAGAALLAAAIVWNLGTDGPQWIGALAARADHCCVAIAGHWRSEERGRQLPPNRE